MRNDNAKWQPAQGLNSVPLSLPDLEMKPVAPTRQTLISGPYKDALALAGLEAASGWPDIATGSPYALRLRCDRILVVDGPELADGWHEAEGLAVSDVTDGYAVIELSGPVAAGTLQRGTEISVNARSASVNRGFAGYCTMIYAFEDKGRFRIHVARAHLEGLWALLASYAEQAFA